MQAASDDHLPAGAHFRRQALDRAPAAPRSVNPSVHRDLETVALRCLEKDPQRRYRSAAAVAEELERFLRSEPIRARQVIDLRLEMERIGGGTVPLEVIMQAYAHLVAFDDQRSGYAHMHPLESDITQRPDPEHPVLTFKLRLPQSGRYVIWSEVQIAGRQVFAPFWFDAVE